MSTLGILILLLIAFFVLHRWFVRPQTRARRLHATADHPRAAKGPHGRPARSKHDPSGGDGIPGGADGHGDGSGGNGAGAASGGGAGGGGGASGGGGSSGGGSSGSGSSGGSGGADGSGDGD